MNTDYRYYRVRKGTKIHRELESKTATCNDNLNRIYSYIRRNGVPVDLKHFVAYGEVIGEFKLNSKDAPDGWSTHRTEYGYAKPKRIKENKELRALMKNPVRLTGESVAKSIFGEARLYFTGRGFICGIAFAQAGNVYFIGFKDEEHENLYGAFPAGLVRTRTSAVVKALEG